MWQIFTLDLVSGPSYLRDSNVCIKVNNGILMKICWREMPAHAYTRHFFGYSQESITKISSLHSRLIFRRRLIGSTVCVHKNFYQIFKKNELLHPTPLKMKWKWAADGRGFDPRVRQHSFVEIVHGIIFTAIISLALIQIGQLSVSI